MRLRILTFRWMMLPVALATGNVVFAGAQVEDRVLAKPAPTADNDPAIAVFEKLQQFESQIEALTGRVEQLEHDLKDAREQEKTRYTDIDTRVGTVEKTLEKNAEAAAQEKNRKEKVAAGDATSTAAAADDAPQAASTTPGDTGASADTEQALFDKAVALVRDKKFEDAVAAFDQVLKRYPHGDLTPTTMYWLGEMWQAVATPDLPKSGRYFYRVYNEYPKSNRASPAMYRHGLIQCTTGETTKGRVTLSKLLIQYPGSTEAPLAESALKQQCQ